MFFFRVLDFVVADAVQALNEHHHGRNAGAGDFRGVMQRTGRQSMGVARRFRAIASSQNAISSLLNRIGSMLPEPLPCNFDFSVLREFLARVSRFAQHSRERSRIEMALIERDPAFFDDAGDDPRLGCARTDRANAAVARFAIS